MNLFLVAVIVVITFAVFISASDDLKCRDYFKGHEEVLQKVGPFRMYGPPKAHQTCQDVCDAHDMALSFPYVGNQACCCAALI